MKNAHEAFTAPPRLIRSVLVGQERGDPDKLAAIVSFHPSSVVDGWLTYGEREEETIYGREAIEAALKEAEAARIAVVSRRLSQVVVPDFLGDG